MMPSQIRMFYNFCLLWTLSLSSQSDINVWNTNSYRELHHLIEMLDLDRAFDLASLFFHLSHSQFWSKIPLIMFDLNCIILSIKQLIMDFKINKSCSNTSNNYSFWIIILGHQMHEALFSKNYL